MGKWKLHRSHSYRFVKEVEDDGARGSYDYTNTDVELYDLIGDPGEAYNVAGKFPEKVAELEALGAHLHAEMDAEKCLPFRPNTTK